MKRKQKPEPELACRTCRWRKEKHKVGHSYLFDRIIHVCHQPSQRTILGVDWLLPDGKPPRLADLGHCDHYQSVTKFDEIGVARL